MRPKFCKSFEYFCYIALHFYFYTPLLSNSAAVSVVFDQGKLSRKSNAITKSIENYNVSTESPIQIIPQYYTQEPEDLEELIYREDLTLNGFENEKILEYKVIEYPLENIFYKTIEISPRTSLKVLITQIDEEFIDFLVVQVHSQSSKIILGYDRIPKKGRAVNNSNAGLVIFLDNDDNFESNSTVYINNYHNEKLSALLLIRNYTNKEPVPGGLFNINSSFALPHPYLFLDQNLLTTWVSFPLASIYPNTSATNASDFYVTTDSSIRPIKYEIYLTYLYEGDMYEEHYWEAVIKTSTVSSLRSNGTKVSEIYGKFPSTHKWIHELFVSYSGVGAVVNVIASYNDTEGVLYSSTVFYGCDFIKEEEYKCTKLVSSFAKLFCASLLFMGIILLLFGHRWLNFTMFLSGFLTSWFLLFVIFVHVKNPNIQVLGICTFFGAVGGGVSWLILWHKFHRPFYSALLIILLSSFFATMVSTHFLKYAIVPTKHNIAAFIVFPILFCIAIIGYSVIDIKKAHIFSCCLLGSYGMVVPFAFYFGSSLTYIVINIVSSMTIRRFSQAVGYPPFQYCDIILLCVWITLFAFGMIYQLFRERSGPPFYPPNIESLKAPITAFNHIKEKVRGCCCICCCCRQPSDEDSLFEDRPRFFSRFGVCSSCNNEARERFSAYESFPRIGSESDAFSLREVVSKPFISAFGFLRQRAIRLRQRLKGQEDLGDLGARVEEEDVEPLGNQPNEGNLETEFDEEPLHSSPLRGPRS